MNDKELAKAVVSLGVGEDHSGDLDWYSFNGTIGAQQRAEQFVRDWRVAGALIEKYLQSGNYPSAFIDYWEDGNFSCVTTSDGYDESLPRAIIEACVEALK